MMSKPSLDVIGDVDVLVETPTGWYSDEPVRLDVIGGEHPGGVSCAGIFCRAAVR